MRRREFVAAGLALGGSVLAGCGENPTAPPTTDDSTAATTGAANPTAATETTTATPERTVMVADEPVIEVTDDAFVPMRLRVEPGTEVTWHNVGGIMHSVEDELFNPQLATEWSFYSMDFPRGARASHTFEEPGAYEYDCGVHGKENMCGVVLVGDVRYGETLPCENS